MHCRFSVPTALQKHSRQAIIREGRLLPQHGAISSSFILSRARVSTKSALIDREDAAAASKPAGSSLGYEKAVLLQGAGRCTQSFETRWSRRAGAAIANGLGFRAGKPCVALSLVSRCFQLESGLCPPQAASLMCNVAAGHTSPCLVAMQLSGGTLATREDGTRKSWPQFQTSRSVQARTRSTVSGQNDSITTDALPLVLPLQSAGITHVWLPPPSQSVSAQVGLAGFSLIVLGGNQDMHVPVTWGAQTSVK